MPDDRLQDRVAARGKRAGRESPDRLLVLDEEDRAVAGQIGDGRRCRFGGTRRLGLVGNVTRQEDRKNGSLADGARAKNIAAGLLDDAINHGEAKTRALSDFLGGEKRLEDFVFYVGRDAMSEILDLDRHIIGGGQRCLVVSWRIRRPPHCGSAR